MSGLMTGIRVIISAFLVVNLWGWSVEGASYSILATGSAAKRHRMSSVLELRGGSSHKKKILQKTNQKESVTVFPMIK